MTRPVRPGVAPWQDPPARVQEVRGSGPPEAGGGAPGDVRFPGHDAFLPMHEDRTLRVGAQAGGATHETHPKGNTDEAAEADARGRVGDGAMAGDGAARLVQPLRGADEARASLRFERSLSRRWLEILRRRSQKDRNPWERLHLLCDALWPDVLVLHPWPDARLAVNHFGGRTPVP